MVFDNLQRYFYDNYGIFNIGLILKVYFPLMIWIDSENMFDAFRNSAISYIIYIIFNDLKIIFIL